MDRRTMIGGFVGGMPAWNLRAAAAGQSSAAAVQLAVREAELGFAATMARRDVAAFATFISDEAVFLGSESNFQPLRGKRAIVAAWRPYFDSATAPFAWEPDLVEVLESGALGLTSGPVRNPRGDLTGRFHSIWRLEADRRWRVVFDRGSQICPPR